MENEWNSDVSVRLDVLEFHGLISKIYTPILNPNSGTLGDSLLYIFYNGRVILSGFEECVEDAKHTIKSFKEFLESCVNEENCNLESYIYNNFKSDYISSSTFSYINEIIERLKNG